MLRAKLPLVLLVALGLIGVGAAIFALWPRADRWTAAETATLRTLWLGSLPPLPADPSNRFADDPRAAALGERLFFDARLSVNGQVSCGTCHRPELGFQDGLPLAQGVGVTDRRTMPLAGMVYSPWLFWDGRKDSLWAQALGPLENPVEHGGTRVQYAHLIAAHYRVEYEALFGALPDLTGLPAVAGPVDDPAARAAWEALDPAARAAVTQIFVNMGKAIAAFERTILPAPTRFDAYVEALLAGDARAMRASLSPDEVAGLRLFIGPANCVQCHNGPLFTDNDFHNTAVPAVPGLPEDTGRAAGARLVLADEFNCLSPYSDAAPEQCAELRFMLSEGEQLLRAFKPPSLRNAAQRPPYMHAGQFATLEETLAHYNSAPPAPAGHSELEPLNLSLTELAQLQAFLHALNE